MELQYLIDGLKYIKPEIAVIITLVLIVTADLIMGKNKKFLPVISLAGLFVAMYFIIEQFNSPHFTAARGMMVISDPFGAFFKFIIVFATIIVIFFSLSSKEVSDAFERHGEFYALMFGMLTGMLFMVSSSDLILVYAALELVSLSSYILAGFTKDSLRNSEASMKYVIYGGASSGIMLFGISIFFGLTGSTNMREIYAIIQTGAVNNVVLMMAGVLVFAGIGYKISAAPFHFWTPDVYEGAPISITAYLSIASKAAGFALLIRFITLTFINDITTSHWQIIGGSEWWKTLFFGISILTMTLGNFAALWQNNVKRMLAYSSIAHAGYLLLGLVVLSDQGLTAIMIYFMIYAIMNLGAFYVVMVIADKTGSEELEDYKGLGYTAPYLGVTLAILLVSLTGLPPTAGFIGKLYIFSALVDGNEITIAVIALLNSVVSLYYYIRVLRNMFLVRPEEDAPMWKISSYNKTVIFVLTAPVIIFGIYFSPLIELAKHSVKIFLP